ncbi:aspartate kinase [uncultured Alistipes sp.]|uniref:aspartate kinase n=1 Tax=uncultured Alistipes sp. TaxID=538949 RepID=UPI00261249B7|nr:aspartate kinase [uncultured Alistipes sp.]
MKVLKFGGTSVGSAGNMKRVAEIVRRQPARITVLSAMSGTTDALVKIAAAAADGDTETIERQLAMLTEKYTACIDGLLASHREEATERMRSAFDTIRREAAAFEEYRSERIVIAQGELLTSAIFTLYLNECGMKAVCLHSPDFMVTDSEEKVDTERIRRALAAVAVDPDTYYVAQGFICTNARGEIDNLGRGGSDYSAALMGAAVDAAEVQIWTDIDGMHNNDPRFVEHTHPIRNMSFDEAAELAYFGAKILHPATIQPCKDHGIPVLLKNTMDPDAPGTTISDRDDDSKSFHAVAAKDGITVIRIHSARMLMAYGFLRKVFEIFEQYRTPIDMITTSEVAVSLTVDNDAHIDDIVRELGALGSIEIERNNSIVCVVGRMEHSDAGLAASVFHSIRNIPIKMISYGASHRSMAMLIETEYKQRTLQSLNDGLF